jgi:hypothetical protein
VSGITLKLRRVNEAELNLPISRLRFSSHSIHSIEVSTELAAVAATKVTAAAYTSATSAVSAFQLAADESKVRVSGAMTSLQQLWLSRATKPADKMREHPFPLELHSQTICSNPG